MKGRRSRQAIGAAIVVLWLFAMASRRAQLSDHPETRWQEVSAPKAMAVGRALFEWEAALGDRRVQGMGAMLVDREGAVQVDLLDPAFVPWARWLVTSRHMAVMLLSERTHFVGYRSGQVLGEALGDHMSITEWWQQVITGRVPSLDRPAQVVENPNTGGLEAIWSNPPLSAVVDPSNVVTRWTIEGSGTGAVVTMKPSQEDALGRPESVIFEQERPALRLELSFSDWQDVGPQVAVSDPLNRVKGFEELPIEALPSALFRLLSSTL